MSCSTLLAAATSAASSSSRGIFMMPQLLAISRQEVTS
jgi:hypothetical protein